MWLFLFGFGAIFAGYAIYIGPMGKKRDYICGKFLNNTFKLCQKQQDLYYLDGMSIISNFSNESDILEIERLYNESSHELPQEFTIIDRSSVDSPILNLYRKIVKDFAIQLWKDVAVVCPLLPTFLSLLSSGDIS
jgi:hypothetical protein